MVLKNLEENNFISKKELKKFKKTELNLKRRKIEILNEANSYTEEVRRVIKSKYGFSSHWSMHQYTKSLYDQFFNLHPELKKYKL